MVSLTDKKEKKQYIVINNNDDILNALNDNPILHLVYKKIPMTLPNSLGREMRRRQYEEQLLEKYSLHKEKTSKFL